MVFYVSIITLIATIALIVIALNYIYNRKEKKLRKSKNVLQEVSEGRVIMVKKYEEVDVSRFAFTFRLCGLTLALLMSLWLMSYKTYDKIEKQPEEIRIEDTQFVELPPQTAVKPPPPPIKNIKPVEAKNDVEPTEKLPPPPEEIDIPFPDVPENMPPMKEGKEEDDNVIINYTAIMPEYPGGDPARKKFIQNNLVYPQMAIEDGIQGLVVLSLVIGKTGEIESIEVVKPLGGGCSQAAIDVVKKMPSWKPGLQLGKPVRVRVSLPIRFKLRDE